MTTGILNIPLGELLKLWGELIEAYHGVNGYGGDTAELYAYRFRRDDPAARLDKVDGEKCQLRKDAEHAAEIDARKALYGLLWLFEHTVTNAKVRIDGKMLYQWQQIAEKFDHRVHVKVVREVAE